MPSEKDAAARERPQILMAIRAGRGHAGHANGLEERNPAGVTGKVERSRAPGAAGREPSSEAVPDQGRVARGDAWT